MAMLSLRRNRRPAWPALPHEEIVKRARILVIDDRDFPYLTLFERDGYTIRKWDDVEDLPALEAGAYDVVLLDLHGVGQELSSDQGLGLLGHLRQVNPSQIVIAYSNAEWSLEYQRFFQLADAALHKSKADYMEFKRTVDTLLDKRFSLGFYLDRIARELEGTGLTADILPRAEKAILSGRTDDLRRYLGERIPDQLTVERVIGIVQIAVGVAALF